MICLYCGRDTDVYNTRTRVRNPSVWRRRRCTACRAEFTTLEKPDYSSSLVVRGVRGKLYPFKRDKLLMSLHKALGHRQDALDSASELTEVVIGKLLRQKKAMDGVLSMRDLASMAHLTLSRFDPMAATTYLAYHKSTLSGTEAE